MLMKRAVWMAASLLLGLAGTTHAADAHFVASDVTVNGHHYPFQVFVPADWTPEMIAILAGSATLSIVVQALSLLVPLRRIGFRYRPVWGIRGHGLGEVSTVAKWTFGSIVVSSLGYLVTSQVLTRATDLGKNAGDPVAGLAAFGPALLIAMLLHGLITVSLITALYTRLSEAAARGDSTEVMPLE